MFGIQDLVHVNALLNAISVVFLLAGYHFIRGGDIKHHKICMMGAVAVSALFLVTYVVYKANSGFAKFGGEGWIRPIYFSFLAVHVVAALSLVLMVPWTLLRALNSDFQLHRKIARKTWPIWMYVGVSGVIIYLMAVHIYPYSA
ncbi:MAG: hypothetical protein CBB68_02450 [Rhodospirillaceae bacterium TMED8]|nr:hypothetical protein [Magnetovibrio sp.]OUT52236.1 MAG: hypothetical protein CBB68_02450 [Rhodospirillaceae bacterium TMED8]|tara:strand:- start:9335 stop:9766 length:432 start_codon:yes stop_codon:yes gene_type:complete